MKFVRLSMESEDQTIKRSRCSDRCVEGSDAIDPLRLEVVSWQDLKVLGQCGFKAIEAPR